MELSTARQSGMGIGPIPFTAIVEYFKIYELEDFDEFAYIIRRLDNVFMDLSSAEPADKSGSDKKNAADKRDKKNPNQDRRSGSERGSR